MSEYYLKDIPIVVKKADYPRKFTKMSHRKRKLQEPPVLECGNASVVFQFEMCKTLLEDMEIWWEYEYSLQGENFNVELYTDYQNKVIEVRFFQELPFYKPRGRHSDSIVDNLEAIVLQCYEKLPVSFQEAADGVYVGDWDFLEYAEEYVE